MGFGGYPGFGYAFPGYGPPLFQNQQYITPGFGYPNPLFGVGMSPLGLQSALMEGSLRGPAAVRSVPTGAPVTTPQANAAAKGARR
jgi:hypothetical protein